MAIKGTYFGPIRYVAPPCHSALLSNGRILTREILEIPAVPGNSGDAEAWAELDVGALAFEFDAHS